MRRRPELMQLEIGISTRRYLPARGTAGLARSLVRGNKRVPCPPPMITESTLLVLIDWRCIMTRSQPSRFRVTYRGTPRGEQLKIVDGLSALIGRGADRDED